MESIVWIIALIGGVYVLGMSTSPSGEIEKISDEKNTYGISENLINILKQKKNMYLIKILIVSIIIFMIISNFLYTQDESITYLLSVIVASILIVADCAKVIYKICTLRKQRIVYYEVLKITKYCVLKGCPNELISCHVDRSSSLGHLLLYINFHIILKIKQSLI